MGALPEWFTPSDVESKAKEHQNMLFWASYYENVLKGFVAVKIHNKHTLEVYDLGVLREVHRNGLGHALMYEVYIYAKKHGYDYITVKTLDESAIYEPYDRSRNFYTKEGFLPLEVFKYYWNEDNPCLYLVKSIK